MSNKIGLWQNESAAGNTYLGGSDKEAGIKYLVFKDDNGTRTLSSKPLADKDAKLKALATLTRFEKDDVVYFKGGDYTIFTNSFKEDDKHPDFNLLINS